MNTIQKITVMKAWLDGIPVQWFCEGRWMDLPERGPKEKGEPNWNWEYDFRIKPPSALKEPTKPGKYYFRHEQFLTNQWVLVVDTIDGKFIATHCDANNPTNKSIKPITCTCNWVDDMIGEWTAVPLFPWESNEHERKRNRQGDHPGVCLDGDCRV
jgi:hypothetical protein